MEFAFLVHPRDLSDVFKKYPLLKFFPEKITRSLLKIISPIVISRVNGLVSLTTKLPVNGILVSIGMTADEMLKNRDVAKKEVIKAVEFSRKKGAKIVGLGALTSSVVNGGVDLVGKYEVDITNGNTLTVGMAMLGIRKAVAMKNIATRPIFAVVGATGSVGSAISKLIAKDNLADKLLLIGRTPKNLVSLRDLMVSNYKNYPDSKIAISTNLSDLKDVDVVVVATSADSALIQGVFLKKNAIVYDITQPRNTSEMIKIERPDILVVDGAIARLPEWVNYNFNLGLPKGTAFSCLAETMLLSTGESYVDSSVGDVDIEKVSIIMDSASRHGITLAPLTSWGEEIEKNVI